MKTNKVEVALHGEVLIRKIDKIPKNASKSVSTTVINNRTVVKLADSETSGNHHVLEVTPNIELFSSGSTIMMQVLDGVAKVNCVHEDRHDTIELPVGCYEFGTQKEYDPFAQQMRGVRD